MSNNFYETNMDGACFWIQSELLRIVDNLNKDQSVDGVLVQLPLPDHLPTDLVCDSVIPSKDVDGFSVTNLGKLYANSTGHVPATARGVRDMVKVCAQLILRHSVTIYRTEQTHKVWYMVYVCVECVESHVLTLTRAPGVLMPRCNKL